MEKLLKNPYLIFLISIPIVIVLGYLSNDATLDLNIHDTYFVITYAGVAQLIALVFGLFSLGYWLLQKFNRTPSKMFNILHLGLVYGGASILWILTKLYREDVMEYQFNDNLSFAIMIISIIIILGQFVFPVNVIYALTRKRNRASR